MMKNYKTVTIKKNPDHKIGGFTFNQGYTVESTVMPNTKRTVDNQQAATEYADYWEAVAESQYNR